MLVWCSKLPQPELFEDVLGISHIYGHWLFDVWYFWFWARPQTGESIDGAWPQIIAVQYHVLMFAESVLQI